MAAGVNYNNVWAALGKPVSVMKYGDHPEFGHHIGGSDASGVVWKVGAGVTRWKVGDEVVVHCNQASYEDPEVHGLDPMAAPSQKIWGYETTWGSFAQFTKVQAQQLLPKPHALTWEEAASYGLVYFTAYRMLITRCKLQAGANVLIWGAAGGLGVFATQICKAAGANCVGVVSSAEKGELVKRLGAVDYIDRDEFAGMMRKGGETAEEEKARSKVARAFAKRVKEILGDAPDIVFEHVGKATLPTSVFTAKTFGKIVICAGTTGIDVDFNVAILWMRQKEILGSHFANAYECTKANELIESGQIRPVLWRTLGFEGVAEAHQLMLENKHLGKISILVGADVRGPGQDRRGPGRDPRGGRRLMAGTVIVPWYATGFRADAFETALGEVAATALRYGASSYGVYRARDDHYKFQQFAAFEEHTGLGTLLGRPRDDLLQGHPLQLVPGAGALRLVGPDRAAAAWSRRRRSPLERHSNGAATAQLATRRRRRARARTLVPRPRSTRLRRSLSALLERGHRQPRALELLPVVLGRLLVAAVDDRLARGVDHVGDLVPALDAHRRG